MTELNGSDHKLANFTNHPYNSPRLCTGSMPSKTVQILTYLILMIFSFVGNVFIVAVVYRNKTLRTAVHYFIVNMAISDLMIPVITLPWMISNTYYNDFWLVDGVLGTVLCKIARSAWPLSACVSILSMIAVAAERFRAVLSPMKSALLSRNKRRLIIAATWVASLAFLGYFLYKVQVVTHDNGRYCTPQWEPTSYSRINIIILLSLVCVSAVVMTVLYSSILISLYRQKKNLHLTPEIFKKRIVRNRKIAYMLVTIVIVFYVGWVPFLVVFYYFFHKFYNELPCVFFWLAGKLIFLNPVLNFVVYYIFNEQYRQGFRELLCCSWLHINNCTACLRPVPPEGENSVHSADQVNNGIELQGQ